MKKSKLIIFSIISMILLSGCGSLKVAKIDKVLDNMNNSKGYTMNVESTVDEVTSKSKMELDKNNNIFRQTSNVDVNGVSTEVIVYTQTVDNKVISYTKGMFGDKWIYSEVEGTSADLDDKNEVLNLDPSKFTKVKSSEKGVYKYEADLSGIEDGEGVHCYVYSDGKYITKIEMTSDSLNEVITFSDVDNTFVIIPEDVKENAKKIDEIDFSDVDTSIIENFEVPNMDTSSIKDQIERAKDYLNSEEYQSKLHEVQDYINSDDFENEIREMQDYMNSGEYQRQVQEAQERARAFLNR